MNRNSEELLDRNLSRLVHHWADPMSDERIARARLTFKERATSPIESRNRWGLLATAAGLLICAAVYGSLFLVRSDGRTVGQADPNTPSLLQDLTNADVLKRDRAAAQLRSLGDKARPPLEQAVKGPSAELRVRAQDVLDRIAVGSAESELDKQRALVAVLDAECTQKAIAINDLKRKLEAATVALGQKEADHEVFVRQLEVQLAQIAELQKKLDAQKK